MAKIDIECNHCNATGYCNCFNCLGGDVPHPTISGVCAICAGSGFFNIETTVSGV